jgi:hypothetical protein
MKTMAAVVGMGLALAMAGCGGAGGGGGGALTVGTPVTGSLGFLSMESVIPGRSSTTMYRAEIWTATLTAGQPVTVLMCRTGNVSFDPYVSVTGPGGTMDNVGTNDDAAGMLNSRLVYMPTSTGSHTIYATTFSSFSSGSTSGSYQLTVFNGEMPTVTCP